MFSALYEPCLENIPLVRLSSTPTPGNTTTTLNSQNNNDKSGVGMARSLLAGSITTLGDVVRSSRFVLFCLFRSGGGGATNASEFFGGVRHLMAQKNAASVARKNSNNSSPAKLKKIFGSLKRSSKKSLHPNNNGNTNNGSGAELVVATVIIDMEPNVVDFNACQIEEPGFYFLPSDSQQYNIKSRLLRSLNFSGAVPSLIVLECAELAVTTAQGRRLLIDDPQGEHFPWTDPPVSDIFKGEFLRNVRNCVGDDSASTSSNNNKNSIEVVDFSTLKPCVKGLYFGAKWCPPCRVITKQLAGAYERVKAKFGVDFEIFFCSSDRSDASFREHFASMPWLAFPFGADKLAQLTRAFDISGIPTFILLDESNRLLSRHGRSVLMSDPTGRLFPWRRTPIYELTEFTVHRIADHASLILFTEGSPDDNEFSQQILKPCADVLFSQLQSLPVSQPHSQFQRTNSMSSNGNNYNNSCGSVKSVVIDDSNNNNGATFSSSQQQSESEMAKQADTLADDIQSVDSTEAIPPWADPIQVFYTGEDPICDFILESLGQGEADLPMLMICDVLAGHMAICERPDVSEEIVAEFVAAYRKGKAKVVPLPTSNERRVGGIPVNLIEQIMSNQQQQQQVPPSPATTIGSPSG